MGRWHHHPAWSGWGEWTDSAAGGRRPGPPPWAGAFFGGPPQRGGGAKVRRGDVRMAILAVVQQAQEPVNGYQVIQRIAEQSSGEWRPSPGSVYPTIQQLEDEGLLVTDETLGRRALRLTEEGTAYLAEHAEEVAAIWRPFERQAAPDTGGIDFKSEIGQVMSAVFQIVSGGSEQQRQAALGVLVEARRKLYGILADGPEQ